jgi:hypothetical protein
MRARILAIFVVSACTSAPPTSPSPVSPPAATAPSASASSASTPSAAPACAGKPVFRDAATRDGLPSSPEQCRHAWRTTVDLDAKHDGCVTDADCSIVSVAGGCMGISLATRDADQVTQIDKACAPDLACWNAGWTDHHIACREGCCSIFER